VPIVLPARTDSMETRMASCVLASLVAARHRATATKAPATAAKASEPLSQAA
jgi:hypothetical protein